MRFFLFLMFGLFAVFFLGFALIGYWPLGFVAALCAICAFTVATVDELS